VDDAIAFLNRIPLTGIMLVVALGWMLGRVEFRGVTLSPAGGVLLVALILGAFGLDFNRLYGATDTLPAMTIGTFGFALFIYAIGYEAGPRFFSALVGNGWRFVLLALATNTIALGVVVGGAYVFGLDGGAAGGTLAGAMTSTPALVAASSVAPDIGQLTLAYAVAYPYGQIGLLLMVAIVPRLLFRKPLSEAGGAESGESSDEDDEGDSRARSYTVENADVEGKSLRELRLPDIGCIVSRVKRGHDVLLPGPELRLQQGDVVMASGKLSSLEKLEALIGPETYDPGLRRSVPHVRRILVARRRAIGRTLSDLNLPEQYKVVVVRVDREDAVLEPTGDLVLQRYDVLEVVGRQSRVRDAARAVGYMEQANFETNIAVYALGILAGMLIGSVSFMVSGVDVTLGSAGGLLLAGLLLGRFRRIGRFSANVPLAARQLVRDLGILLFVSEAGVQGGAALAGGFEQSPIAIVVTGFFATTLTVLGTLYFGQKLLRLKPLDAWGAVCGGMTSTTSLEAVNRAAGNNDAVVGYAATYAVACVLITLAGQMAVHLGSAV
jgi:putative transport protein